jgi:hypothetical protein
VGGGGRPGEVEGCDLGFGRRGRWSEVGGCEWSEVFISEGLVGGDIELGACTSKLMVLERKRDQRKGREEGGERAQRREAGEADDTTSLPSFFKNVVAPWFASCFHERAICPY